jgi:hypothetical protein
MSLERATQFLERCTAASWKFAGRALDEVLAGLRERGYEVVHCGILTGSGRKLPDLADTLASHPLIHTAEGEFFRAASLTRRRRSREGTLDPRARRSALDGGRTAAPDRGY